MTSLDPSLREWTNQCRRGELSRRSFFRHTLAAGVLFPVTVAQRRQSPISATPAGISQAPLPQKTAEPTVRPPTTPILHCSFCYKQKDEVAKLIPGPKVFICNECVEVCNDIIADDTRLGAAGRACALCGRPSDWRCVIRGHHVCRDCVKEGARVLLS